MTEPKPTTRLVWRLHTVMSERGIRSSAELHRRLEPYGIDITRPRLSRIVKELPARLNTQVLHALLVELQCSPDELFRVQEVAPTRKAASTPAPRKRSKAVAAPAAPPAVTQEAPVAPVTPPRKRASKALPAAAAPDVPADVLGPSVTSLASRRPLKTP